MHTETHPEFTPPAVAKLFWNGKSQAVRLPKAFRLEGAEVLVRKSGQDIILSPKTKGRKKKASPWDDMFAAMPQVDDDFMNHRPLNRPLNPKNIF
jgi:antitoxin VapB